MYTSFYVLGQGKATFDAIWAMLRTSIKAQTYAKKQNNNLESQSKKSEL